jgi:hypothetical protein
VEWVVAFDQGNYVFKGLLCLFRLGLYKEKNETHKNIVEGTIIQ